MTVQGIRNQFIEVIEWLEASDDVLAYRYPVESEGIHEGAQLEVRDSQAALFVDRGRPADVFSAGRYDLTTGTLPVAGQRQSWTQLSQGPIQGEVYFYSLRHKLGQRWGTREPITCHHPQLGNVALKIAGVLSYHVRDVASFYREVSGPREQFTTDDLLNQLLSLIASALTGLFQRGDVTHRGAQLDAALLSSKLRAALEGAFARLGLALDSFTVEHVTQLETLELSVQNTLTIPSPSHQQQPGVSSSTPTLAPPALGLSPCGACRQQVDPDSAFCRFCGAAQRRSCPSCRATLQPGSAFCGGCGHKLTA